MDGLVSELNNRLVNEGFFKASNKLVASPYLCRVYVGVLR